MYKFVICVFCLVICFASCNKEIAIDNCNGLKQGIIQNDADRVKKSITNFISGLQNQNYSSATIAALCKRISVNCSVTAEPRCFDCIQTLPSQSEIVISISTASGQVSKTIDLSYTQPQKLIFSNMHD